MDSRERHYPNNSSDPQVNLADRDGALGGVPPPVDPHEAALNANEANAPLLSAKEIQILKQCEREAIMNRGLPGGAFGAALAVLAVKAGRLTSHPTYGAFPKALGLGLLGFFVGRFSYASVCVDRVLQQAPESGLAQRIRKQRGLSSPFDDESGSSPMVRSSRDSDLSGYSSGEDPLVRIPPTVPPSSLPESDPSYAPPSKMRRKNKYGDDVYD